MVLFCGCGTFPSETDESVPIFSTAARSAGISALTSSPDVSTLSLIARRRRPFGCSHEHTSRRAFSSAFESESGISIAIVPRAGRLVRLSLPMMSCTNTTQADSSLDNAAKKAAFAVTAAICSQTSQSLSAYSGRPPMYHP